MHACESRMQPTYMYIKIPQIPLPNCTHFAHRVVGQDSYYTVQLNIGTSRGGVKTIAQTANYGLVAEYMDSFKYPLVDSFLLLINLPVTGRCRRG